MSAASTEQVWRSPGNAKPFNLNKPRPSPGKTINKVYLKDLCAEEKQKIAHLIRTIGKLQKEKVELQKKWDHERAELEIRIQQLQDYQQVFEMEAKGNVASRLMFLELKTKYTQSNITVKTYQTKVDELIEESTAAKKRHAEEKMHLESQFAKLQTDYNELQHKYTELQSQATQKQNLLTKSTQTKIRTDATTTDADILPLRYLAPSFEEEERHYVDATIQTDSEPQLTTLSIEKVNHSALQKEDDSLFEFLQTLEEQQTKHAEASYETFPNYAQDRDNNRYMIQEDIPLHSNMSLLKEELDIFDVLDSIEQE